MSPAPRSETSRLCAGIASLLAAAALSLGCAGPKDTSDPLSSARHALGHDSAAHSETGWSARGDNEVFGVHAEMSLLWDNAVSFVSTTAGNIGMTTGFDGRTVWESDASGFVRTLEGAERNDALLTHWFRTGQWVHPETNLVLAPSDVPHTLAFTLGERTKGAITLDPATGRARQFTWNDGEGDRTLTIESFQRFRGRWLPARSTFSQSGLSSTATIESLEPAPVFIRNPYEPVASAPSPARFDDTQPAALQVKRARTGHLLVKPIINGRDAGWFIFDTGAGINCIDAAAAADLNLGEGFGKIVAVGIGGRVTTTLHQPQTMTLGPVTLENPVLMALDLKPIALAMGEDITGAIGYNLLTHVVAEIDLESAAISLHDPARYPGAPWQDLRLVGRQPCVEAEFEGHKGLFKLDTGAAGSVIDFHAPAVAHYGLLNNRATKQRLTGGVGGMVRIHEGPLTTFTLAGHTFENLTVGFMPPTDGAFGDTDTVGNIGGKVLAPFTLVTDYRNARVAFVKREKISQ